MYRSSIEGYSESGGLTKERCEVHRHVIGRLLCVRSVVAGINVMLVLNAAR